MTHHSMSSLFARLALISGIILSILGSPFKAQAANPSVITGAGATFPLQIYSKWAESLLRTSNISLNYQAIGSGGGVKQILAKTVDFGASDIPQTLEWQSKNNLLQFPAIIGGIVPAINLKGIKPGTIKLTGEILADIYLGKVKKWNDAPIAALNPGTTLPDLAISVIYRNDGSGTTFNFSDYLAKKSADWKKQVGVGNALEWPTGFGAKGNDGVAALVKQQNGAIGYVEYAFIKQQGLNYALLQNLAGKYPQPSLASFEAAAANADWENALGYYQILTDQPGANSWPITATSFVIVPRQVDNPTQLMAVLKFFAWAFENGQKAAHDLDYATLPPKLVKKIIGDWRYLLTDKDKNPVWTGK